MQSTLSSLKTILEQLAWIHTRANRRHAISKNVPILRLYREEDVPSAQNEGSYLKVEKLYRHSLLVRSLMGLATHPVDMMILISNLNFTPRPHEKARTCASAHVCQ